MRAALAAAAPTHACYGEEEGMVAGAGGGEGGDYLWVVDPIDGTKSFITGREGREERKGKRERKR